MKFFNIRSTFADSTENESIQIDNNTHSLLNKKRKRIGNILKIGKNDNSESIKNGEKNLNKLYKGNFNYKTTKQLNSIRNSLNNCVVADI